MKFFATIILFASILCFSCKHSAKNKQGGSSTIPPNKTLTVQFFPFWGGSAEGILERKNGKDKLYSTYNQKIHGVDTVLTSITEIEKTLADSVYNVAEKVKWNADANYGTASENVGLKVFISFHKGRNEQSVGWEKLKNVSDLPVDIINLVQLMNEISPPDFKLY